MPRLILKKRRSEPAMKKITADPSPKRSGRKELLRDEFLSKAADLFGRRGFANTSIQDIARELGMSRSSLYHYFDSKDDVLRALVVKGAAGSAERYVRVHDDRLTSAQRLRLAVLGTVSKRLTDGSIMRVVEQLQNEMPDDLLAQVNQVRRQTLQSYVDIIDAGVRSGEFRPVDPKLAAFAVIGMCSWTSLWYSPKGSLSPDQIGESMADFALKALNNGRDSRGQTDTLDGVLHQLKDDVTALERLVVSSSRARRA